MNRITEDRWCIRDMVNMYRQDGTGDIYLPDSQRLWAWKNRRGELKKQRLIDSVMNRFPIPNCILHRTDLRRFQVYDGRHRIETFYLYANDEFAWNGKKYSELTEDEQRQFDSREVPVTIISNATVGILAEMFIRLNQGVPLKDYDLFWANRNMPLIQSVERLVRTNERLSNALGGLDMKRREDLANWVALVSGLDTREAGNMTTSYVRVCEDIGLSRSVNETAAKEHIDKLCELLELANERFPALDKEKRQLKKVGKIIAYFFHDWFTSRRDPAIINKWVGIIGKLRGTDEERAAMNGALSISGAQNLTSDKVKRVVSKVNDYLERNIVLTVEDESDDESQ